MFKSFINKVNINLMPIILTWRNSTCDYYNNIVRRFIHKNSDITDYIIGDFVMFNNFYKSPEGSNFYTSDIVKIVDIIENDYVFYDWNNFKNDTCNNPKQIKKETTEINPITTNKKKIVVTSKSKYESETDRGFIFLIKKLVNLTRNVKIKTLTVKNIKSSNANNTNNLSKDEKELTAFIDKTTINIIHQDYIETYQNMIDGIRTTIEMFYRSNTDSKIIDKLWVFFHSKFIDRFADIRYGHSITTHKAQDLHLIRYLLIIVI